MLGLWRQRVMAKGVTSKVMRSRASGEEKKRCNLALYHRQDFGIDLVSLD